MPIVDQYTMTTLLILDRWFNDKTQLTTNANEHKQLLFDLSTNRLRRFKQSGMAKNMKDA